MSPASQSLLCPNILTWAQLADKHSPTIQIRFIRKLLKHSVVVIRIMCHQDNQPTCILTSVRIAV